MVHSICTAELHGIVSTLCLIYFRKEWVANNRTMIINTDNQAYIQAIEDSKNHSGQVFVIQAMELINILRDAGIGVDTGFQPTSEWKMAAKQL